MNILLSGVGGQGTVLASRLIAQASIDKGIPAKTAETIGMAQRGGCVVSHVRTGISYSPLIPYGEADIIIGFEPAETVRVLPYLKEGGYIITTKQAILPVTSSLSKNEYRSCDMIDYLKSKNPNTIVIDGHAICNECGSGKILNIALIGAAVASSILNITIEEMEKTIKEHVAEKFINLNLLALKLGAPAVSNQSNNNQKGEKP